MSKSFNKKKFLNVFNNSFWALYFKNKIKKTNEIDLNRKKSCYFCFKLNLKL